MTISSQSPIQSMSPQNNKQITSDDDCVKWVFNCRSIKKYSETLLVGTINHMARAIINSPDFSRLVGGRTNAMVIAGSLLLLRPSNAQTVPEVTAQKEPTETSKSTRQPSETVQKTNGTEVFSVQNAQLQQQSKRDDGYFQCNNTDLIPQKYECDNTLGCIDRSDEDSHCDRSRCEFLGRFVCEEDGVCIPGERECDGEQECKDNSDEADCTKERCTELGRYICQDNTCLPELQECDSYTDCKDESDESNCTKSRCETLGRSICDDGVCYLNDFECDGTIHCKDDSDEGSHCDQKRCDELGRPVHCDNNHCIPQDWLCDGKVDCSDNSDEPANCSQIVCDSLSESHLCDNGKCIDIEMVCDGDNDCGDFSDEGAYCAEVLCEQKYQGLYCNDGSCIDPKLDCDNDFDWTLGIIGVVVILGLLVTGYTACVYRSYKKLRKNDSDSTTCQLIGRAARAPLTFNSSHQPVPTRQPATESGTGSGYQSAQSKQQQVDTRKDINHQESVPLSEMG